ncbi:MAG: transcription elongation factor GreA [Clostridia bacterium]|nr:transcription elongation factor GreA [Clostridia bacterium]MBR2302750.1 transcription elongation factor GreA [Clostridia bacterium]
MEAKMEEVILTQKGYDELKARLHLLKTEKRQEIAQVIEEARAQGDLSENAEYDAAKDEQGHIEGEIIEIEAKLRHAKIIDDMAAESGVVSIGSEVKIINYKTNKELVYRIVGTTEADPFKNKISNESPVGKALLGHKVDDVVDVAGPAGTIQLKILAIN